jgi:hypothetical protein
LSFSCPESKLLYLGFKKWLLTKYTFKIAIKTSQN